MTLDEVQNHSHYKYLESMLEPFWKEVFNKTPDQMWCGGIVSAHGDKGYGYRAEWEEHGIRFNRGMLIYLLTYTSELGDVPKSESGQWVIDNYEKYLPIIERCEATAFDPY